MHTYRVLNVWTFAEWNQLEKEHRPAGARPYANGWVLLEKMPAAAKPAPPEPPRMPPTGPGPTS